MLTVDFEEYEGVRLCNVCSPSGSPPLPTHLQMFDSMLEQPND